MATKPASSGLSLHLRDWITDTNLLTINWQRLNLKRIANEHNLKPFEAVIFENVARDKARLVVNLNGLIVLLIPPIDTLRQLSTHLEVSLFLRGMAGTVKLRNGIDKRAQDINERLALRKERKAAAAKRRVTERRQAALKG